MSVPGGKVYTRIFDQGKRILGVRLGKMRDAMVMIHGGPGYPHNYLENLSALSDVMPVLFYDQLGCGRSEKSDDISLWKIGRFVEELEAIRKFYGLEKLILHGHSWGTIVALEYTLKYPDFVKAVIFESPCLSIPLWKKDSLQLITRLDGVTQKVIEDVKKTYRFNSPEFIAAVDLYYQNFVHHERPKPEVLLYCDAHAGAQVYTTMWGPCEFIVSGSLSDYNRMDSLVDINVPVLFTAGEYDEVLPETLATYVNHCPGSTSRIFKGARHFPHIDSCVEYESLLRDFIGK